MTSVRVLALPVARPASRAFPRARFSSRDPLRQPSVFIMLVSETVLADETFAALPLQDGDIVARLVGRACEKFGWGAPSRCRLFLVAPPDGVDEPSADAIKDALSGERLQSSWPLERAGIRPGSWLLARMPPPAAAPGASRRRAGGPRARSLKHLHRAPSLMRSFLAPFVFPEQADEQAGAPQTFGETLLCYLLPRLRLWLLASFLRPLLGSALLNFSLALGSSYLSVDSSRAGLQVLILHTLAALALTLKVPLKIKMAFAVLFALVLTPLSFHHLDQVVKKTD